MRLSPLLGLLPVALAFKANPLPAPQNLTWIETDSVVLRKSLNIDTDSPIVEAAFDRIWRSALRLKWTPAAAEETGDLTPQLNLANLEEIRTVVVDIEDISAELQHGVDESYTLEVNSTGVYIEAPSPWGALHALNTLYQIVFYDDATGKYFIESSVIISDWPLYPHRGILVDSARNFLTIESLLDQIDIMALAKFNVLHWHITDSQSWPLELDVYPVMANGSYTPRQRYSKEDVDQLVEYANARGVRVMPELDMPGHSRAGYKQLDPSLLACADSWHYIDEPDKTVALEPPPGQLEILNNKTYEVVKNIYSEMSLLFPENFFHVGLDELQEGCYNLSNSTQEWFAANRSRTYSDLTQLWVDNTMPIFKNRNDRRVVMWEDVLTAHKSPAHNLPKDVILQSWANADTNNIKNLTRDGYDVIVSSNDHLYLDCGYGGWLTNDPRYVDVVANEDFNTGWGGSWCAPYKTWQRIYDFDFAANLTTEEKKHIIGAEAALWSEQVDSTVLIQKIWPRSAALAESLWSGNRDPATGYLRTQYLTQRIFNFREFLTAQSYAASPLVPYYCLQNPHGCDLYRNRTILDDYS